MKKCFFLIVLSSIIFSCGRSNESPESQVPKIIDWAKCESVEVAKQQVDLRYDDLLKKYSELCSRPRNYKLKKDFEYLRDQDLLQLFGCQTFTGWGCALNLLSKEDQRVVLDYSQQKIKSNPDLLALYDNSTVRCW